VDRIADTTPAMFFAAKTIVDGAKRFACVTERTVSVTDTTLCVTNQILSASDTIASGTNSMLFEAH
jgi:hypothetical protein